jgi:16S rRNA (guanine1516-N2)-methyltransferase
MGCQVEGMEQSPVIFLLVSDGLRRLKESAEQALVVARMKLSWGDSMSFLQTLPITDFPDVIYLDPMYPLRKKSALPKKELQWLRSHIGANLVNDKKLLQVALSRCRERVVVKRPRKAPPLAESVWQSFSGSTTRYDVYRSIDLKKGSQ